MNPGRTARITGLAVLLAIPAEGIRYVAYYDPPGILTVCRGHTGPDVQKGRRYTLAECDALMDADMRRAVVHVERCAPGAPEPVAAAFADAVYNLGPVIACDRKQSTAARLLATKSWTAACNQLPRWNKARIGGVLVPLPGLTDRRAMEQHVCLTGELPA